MEHLGTKRIETERLTLRPFRMEDADDMYRNWANDDEVTKFLTWPTHGSVEVSREVLRDWTSHYDEKNYYQWAIVLKGERETVIGSIAAVHLNDRIRMAHIGYCIGRNWWHQGLMSEALSAVIRFFFTEVGVNRIEARHDIDNANSGKVMKKCGMQFEGTKRQADWNNQGVCDLAEYAILAEDFLRQQKIG